ncbi:MAG: hypothetical protein ACOVOT_02695 [Rubrivivax sp.]|jgi:hypothetical protein|nr:hypothetical protein [Rubrivivax sp.]
MKSLLIRIPLALRAGASRLLVSVLLVAGAAGVALLLPVEPSPAVTVAQGPASVGGNALR